MRFVKISQEELKMVCNLYKKSDNSVVRERCMFLKLSHQKKSMMEIARTLGVGRWRIRSFFTAWEQAKEMTEKQATLGIKKGRGAKSKLEKVKEKIPDLVEKNARNLNVVLDILKREYGVEICKETLRNFLKQTGL